MISGGNTVVGSGPVTIDALRSIDPDGEPGALSFSWACTPSPTPGATASPASSACLTAAGAPLNLEGVTDASVPFELLGSAQGRNYTITATVSKGPRSASASVWLSVLSNRQLPTVRILGVTARAFNPADKLTLLAAVESADPGSVSTMWSVVSPPGLRGLLAAPGVAATALTSQSLVVNPNSLPPRTTVVLRLTAVDGGGGQAQADVTVPVSGAPTGLGGRPRGNCAVTPGQGSGLQTVFTLSADNWTDTDLPLSYSFAYEVLPETTGAAAPVRVPLQDFRPQSSASFLLPAGLPGGNYAVRVLCAVQNAFGVSAEVPAQPPTVTVRWDQALLESPEKQAALVDSQAAEASALVRTGRPDGALAAATAVSGLLNTETAGARGGARRRARSLRELRAAAAEAVAASSSAAAPLSSSRRPRLLAEQAARAAQREALLGVVSDVVTITAEPTPTVRC